MNGDSAVQPKIQERQRSLVGKRGRCSPCRGYVEKTTSVSEECKKTSPKFMGNKYCAKACRSNFQSSWSWVQANAKIF